MRRHESGSWEHEDDPGEPSTSAPRLSVTDEEATILSAIAANRTVAEIGTGLGVSTRALARWARQVDTVDIDPWVHTTIWPDLPANVRPFPSVTKLGRQRYDVVFIDADHNADPVRADLEWAFDHVWSWGLIVCHDAKSETVNGEFRGEWLRLDTAHGIAVRNVADP